MDCTGQVFSVMKYIHENFKNNKNCLMKNEPVQLIGMLGYDRKVYEIMDSLE